METLIIVSIAAIVFILVVAGMGVTAQYKFETITDLVVSLRELIEPVIEETPSAELQEEINALKRERTSLKETEIPNLKREIKKLESQRKIEDEEIKHMLKMKEEREALEREKFETKCTREKDDEIAKVKDEYANKLRDRLEQDIERGDARFVQILQRLPTATIEMKEDRNTTRDQYEGKV